VAVMATIFAGETAASVRCPLVAMIMLYTAVNMALISIKSAKQV